jgi:hypothetical protein
MRVEISVTIQSERKSRNETMKQSRFTEEQIILALRQQESRKEVVAEISRELAGC